MTLDAIHKVMVIVQRFLDEVKEMQKINDNWEKKCAVFEAYKYFCLDAHAYGLTQADIDVACEALNRMPGGMGDGWLGCKRGKVKITLADIA